MFNIIQFKVRGYQVRPRGHGFLRKNKDGLVTLHGELEAISLERDWLDIRLITSGQNWKTWPPGIRGYDK